MFSHIQSHVYYIINCIIPVVLQQISLPYSHCDSDDNCQHDFKIDNCYETCSYAIKPVSFCFQFPDPSEYNCHIGANGKGDLCSSWVINT